MLEGQGDHRFENQDMVNKDFGEVRKDEKCTKSFEFGHVQIILAINE